MAGHYGQLFHAFGCRHNPTDTIQYNTSVTNRMLYHAAGGFQAQMRRYSRNVYQD